MDSIDWKQSSMVQAISWAVFYGIVTLFSLRKLACIFEGKMMPDKNNSLDNPKPNPGAWQSHAHPVLLHTVLFCTRLYCWVHVFAYEGWALFSYNLVTGYSGYTLVWVLWNGDGLAFEPLLPRRSFMVWVEKHPAPFTFRIYVHPLLRGPYKVLDGAFSPPTLTRLSWVTKTFSIWEETNTQQ